MTRSLSELGDLELFERVQQRDCEAAFEELYARYCEKTRELCLSIMRHPQDAEDAVQLAWLQVWYKRHTFEARAAWSSWLYRVTWNAAAMRRRKLNRRWRESESLEERLAESDYISDSMCTKPNREQELTVLEIVEDLRQCIPRLTQSEQDVVMYIARTDCGAIEYAAAYPDITLPAAKSRLTRARVQLRKWMGDPMKRLCA